jgi:hypothetical protein
MKAVRLAMLVVALLFCVLQSRAEVELPQAAKEVLAQLEKEAVEIDKDTQAELKKRREKLTVELKKLLDAYDRDGQLDEAGVVRGLIRWLEGGSTTGLSRNSVIPAAVSEVMRQHRAEQAEIRKKGELELLKRKEKIAVELKKLQDAFCRETKLEEAVAIRDAIREGLNNPLPDPCVVHVPESDIGRVFYFQTTGGNPPNWQICGNDVYAIGSHLGMAAVHCGALKEGQKGVVKVTILPRQKDYPSTTRNGVTSRAWTGDLVSFKVERIVGFAPKQPAKPVAEEKK